MKMNALSYMIKYLPYLLGNFPTVIYKEPVWQNVDHFKNVETTTIYIIKRFTSTYLLSCKNHTIFKSLRIIMNIYSYQINQCFFTNILNR